MDPSSFFRAFRNSPGQHVVALNEPGLYRLASTLFKSSEVSVDDGALCSAADTCRRSSRTEPCGVASVAKALVAELGLTCLPNPVKACETEEENPAHVLIKGLGREHRKQAERHAAELCRAAKIRIPHPDIVVVPYDGAVSPGR